jgi:hypothetical protein
MLDFAIGAKKATKKETATPEKLSIRFSDNVSFRKTLSRKDYTPEDVEASWYSHEESKAISTQCIKEIKRMDMGEKLKDKKYCSRGLEGHTTIGAESKMRNRKVAIDAVLDEQLIQWEEGIYDEELIGDIYYEASIRCQVWAHHIGKCDQQAAMGRSSSNMGPSCNARKHRKVVAASA